jgi:hypothetical protein
MMALLQQLLHNDSLSPSWRDIIVSLVCQVVQTVRPDVKTQDDDMDIRQFVHIKMVTSATAFLLLAGVEGGDNLSLNGNPKRVIIFRVARGLVGGFDLCSVSSAFRGHGSYS